MDEASTLILKRYFKEYYFRNSEKIKSPSEIESREFGYFPFGGGMVRHLSFKEIGSLRAELFKEAPAGVYCSNSLYSDPSKEMHLKGWIRAELIFDIDADALRLPCKKEHDIWLCKGCGRKEFGLRPETCPNCRGNKILEMSWACRNCLEGTKKETFKLLDTLESDFGVSGSKIKVYFSGSAGYHVHVIGSDYETLDTHARAELADYLTAQGIMPEAFLSTRLTPNDPGWRGKVARHVRDLPPESTWFKTDSYELRLKEFVTNFSPKKVKDFISEVSNADAVRIDAMVTTDIHRIFRMAETLNNKTGLVKRECVDLTSFDPSIEAIALKESAEPLEVMVDMCPKIELGGHTYGPFVSVTKKLPTFVAVYILAKGAGKLVTQQTIQKASG
jgi:DNA primase small subunit